MAALWNTLDVIGVILGIYLLYLLNQLLKKSLDKSTLIFLKTARVGITLWLLNNAWHAARQIFNLKSFWGESAEYPEYIFIMLAYLAFMLAAYQTKFITKQFAFQPVKTKRRGRK